MAISRVQQRDPWYDRAGDFFAAIIFGKTRDSAAANILRAGALLTFGGFLTAFFVPFLSGAWVPGLAAILWALGLYAMGVLLGFMFSIARVIAPDGSNASSERPSGELRYLPNTGVEQIADWLTKTIVGLSLVELKQIPGDITRLAAIIAASLGGIATITGLAYGMVLFFPTMGFLAMYLSMRIWINELIRKGDAGESKLKSAQVAAVENPQTTLKDPNKGVTDASKAAASDIADIKFSELNSASDIASWARAKTILGEWQQAIQGYAKATALNPTDPKLRLDYAVALFNNGADPHFVVDQLQVGLRFVDEKQDPELAASLYQNLVLAYLYIDPPQGFTNAIVAGEGYLQSSLPKRPVIYFYLACAYGQKYTYLKSRPNTNQDEIETARERVIHYTGQALMLNPSLKDRFRMISDPTDPTKDKKDNDLEALRDDPEFKKLVWD